MNEQYGILGTTRGGLPVRVQVGFDGNLRMNRLVVECTEPELLGDPDGCLFSTDLLPARLLPAEPAHLLSVLEGMGLQDPLFGPRNPEAEGRAEMPARRLYAV